MNILFRCATEQVGDTHEGNVSGELPKLPPVKKRPEFGKKLVKNIGGIHHGDLDHDMTISDT